MNELPWPADPGTDELNFAFRQVVMETDGLTFCRCFVSNANDRKQVESDHFGSGLRSGDSFIDLIGKLDSC